MHYQFCCRCVPRDHDTEAEAVPGSPSPEADLDTTATITYNYEGDDISPLHECEGTRKDDLYAGLGKEVPLLVMPREYFEAYSANRGSEFVPAAVHIYGEVLIRSVTCTYLKWDLATAIKANALDLLARGCTRH